MRNLFVCLLVAVPLISGCCQPGVHQSGKVTQHGDFPCFGVADTDETRRTPPRLAGLTVEEMHIGQRGTLMWNLSFLGGRPVYLSPGQCIPYGDASRGSGSWLQKARALRPGAVYSYGLNSDIDSYYADGSSANRAYSGHFCLTHDSAGKITVHDIRWDEKAQRRHWEVCELAPDQEPTF